ncbi:MAG: hypothetical protein JNL97_03375 [Verrucomicrobiales bacterium]|nr:hypothetical protein [Verrucomicrobiales bacterium]
MNVSRQPINTGSRYRTTISVADSGIATRFVAPPGIRTCTPRAGLGVDSTTSAAS